MMPRKKKQVIADTDAQGTTDQFSDYITQLAAEHQFILSVRLEEIEEALKELLARKEKNSFWIAVLFGRIEQYGLFKKIPGCHSADQYFRMSEERLCQARQTISHHRKIAKGYEAHLMRLHDYNIDPLKVVTKMAHISQAWENHGHEEATLFDHLRNDTVEDFKRFAAVSQKRDGSDGATSIPDKRSKSTCAHTKIKASGLEPQHAEIARILSRRNHIKVVAVAREEDGVWLRDEVELHRSEVYSSLMKAAELSVPADDPLSIPIHAGLFAVEEAIRRALRQADVPEAAIAVAIYRIETDQDLVSQWGALNFRSARAYCESRIGIGSRYNWYQRIGMTIWLHGRELAEARIPLAGNLYKFYYFEQAWNRADSDEGRQLVLKRLATDSFREFKQFARGERTDAKEEAFPEGLVKRAFKLMARISTIVESGRVPVVLELLDMNEEPFVNDRVSNLNYRNASVKSEKAVEDEKGVA